MRSPLALAKREQRFKGSSLQPESQREAGLRPRSPSAGMPRATSTPKLLDQAGDGAGELPLPAMHLVGLLGEAQVRWMRLLYSQCDCR